MKYLLFLLVFASNLVVAGQERTLDERCDGHANYVMKLLKNRYQGETLSEQTDLVNEWSDPVYRDEIKKLLELDENLNVVYLLAVGYPKQESKIVDMKDNDVKYYEDENGVINVPKRSLEEILIK